MPIYKLEPVEGLESHNDWRASGVGTMAVWVHASDPGDARQKIHLATINSVSGYEAGELVPSSSPWLNSAVVSCDQDDTRAVPAGMALLGNGKTITI
jgi:hypothetical protein